MKTTKWIALLAGCGLCFAQIAARAQDFKTHVSKQFPVTAGSVVAVYNLNGPVKVEGYAGSQVIIEIDETITGRSPEDVDKGKQELKLGFDQKADSLIAYTAFPYDTRPHKWDNYDGDKERRYYNVKLEYILKVPYNVSLRLSTVNNGNIDVKDVTGTLKINNVNGPITIANAKGTTDAHTVNGGITVNYLTVPPDACSYYTVNGKLDITYPASLAVNIQFKSMNGEFFTDFPDTEFLPTEVIVNKNKKDNGTTYKLEKSTQVKFGAGGKQFKFETLNGNIYIKKQS